MRRALCICHPHHVMAGQKGNWKFSYTPADSLPKGTLLEFDLGSLGTEGEWEIPEVGQLSAVIGDSKKIAFKKTGDSIFSCQLPQELKAGMTLLIQLNDNKAQLYLQRRRSFVLKIHTKDGQVHQEQFLMDVRGNILHRMLLVTPSFVQKGKRFDIVIRFEDVYGNLTHNAPEDTLIELSYEQLRENLNWKLFVPETGFVCLPNLYFNEPGLFRIQLKNLTTGDLFFSDPICCYADLQKQLFWGALQADCDKIHPKRGYDSYLRYFRDEGALSFFSPFVDEHASEEIWKQMSHHVTELNENERFTPFLGSFWKGTPQEEGARHLLFSKDQKPLVLSSDPKYNTLKKVYKIFSSKELLAIPTLTTIKEYAYDFNQWDDEFERVAEIYNGWENAEEHLKEALLAGKRFGFVAGGTGRRGLYPLLGTKHPSTTPGLTAVIAKEHTRDSLFEALSQRHCYGTTGEPILIGFNLISQPMGSELSTQTKPGLVINRHFTGYVAGTDTLKKVELLRNGVVIHQFIPDAPKAGSWKLDFEFDDTQELGEVVVASETGTPFVFYYLRVEQMNGHKAWSSPIWLDYQGGKVTGSSTKATPAKSKKSK